METFRHLVYFIKCREANAVKIGCTNHHPDKRLDSLQTGNPFELVRAGVIRSHFMSESAVHKKFRASHVRGEWFRLTPDLLEFMAVHLEPRPTSLGFRNISVASDKMQLDLEICGLYEEAKLKIDREAEVAKAEVDERRKKVRVVELVLLSGKSPMSVAAMHKMNVRTLTRWIREAPHYPEGEHLLKFA